MNNGLSLSLSLFLLLLCFLAEHLRILAFGLLSSSNEYSQILYNVLSTQLYTRKYTQHVSVLHDALLMQIRYNRIQWGVKATKIFRFIQNATREEFCAIKEYQVP